MNKYHFILFVVAMTLFAGVVTTRAALIENGMNCEPDTACSTPIDAAQ